MLVLGKNIQSANDPLTRMESIDVYRMITNRVSPLASQIEQLRTVLSIDPKKYGVLKRTLPYVVCGVFTPPYRRLENFASIDCFMVDIDHLSEKGIDRETLRTRLINDPRVELLFTSPGNDGLKVLFKLSDKCYDRQKYSIFYKLFIHHFSAEYSLEQVIDKVTSDATRACFLSFDENAFHNPDPTMVSMDQYINFDSYTDVQEAKTLIKETEVKSAPPAPVKELTPDLLAEIKNKLNPNIRKEKAKDFYVPEAVEQVMEELKSNVADYGIELSESHPIQYGRKLKFRLQQKWAQLNIFYGKKGYKIVKTPVTNSDAELADVVHQILCKYFFGES
jgi:hypothetical protein